MTAPDEPARREDRARPASGAGSPLDGSAFARLLGDAAAVLDRHIPALNAINVFPVPDGDTGTNMSLTLRAGVEALERADTASVAEAAGALAQGALMGARGNSGVILSQVLRGLAMGLEGRDEAGGPALAGAFGAAARAAYEALSEPVEGTILTVARETAEALERAPPASAGEALATAAEAARSSADRTPELLPVLREAGVVDAGALGLAVIIEGLRRSHAGEPLDVDLAPDIAIDASWRAEAASLHEAAPGESGYCTEYVVRGAGLEAAGLRGRLEALGTSVLVVGGDDLLHVHLHTTQPDDAMNAARSLGQIEQIKIDNLESQIGRFVGEQAPEPIAADVSVVVVAAGAGIEGAFRSVGVTHVVRGGQTMNPSAAEILEAIESCGTDRVIVLPNNKNIVAAARQAAGQSRKRVAVVPTRTVPQGIAAVLAMQPDASFEENSASMERAAASVRTAEVTRAVRATTIEGRQIDVGQAIGIIDGALRVVAEGIDGAVEACLEELDAGSAGLLTVYAGEEVRAQDAEALAGRLRERYPALEIELIDGGQPHYPYILSLE